MTDEQAERLEKLERDVFNFANENARQQAALGREQEWRRRYGSMLEEARRVRTDADVLVIALLRRLGGKFVLEMDEAYELKRESPTLHTHVSYNPYGMAYFVDDAPKATVDAEVVHPDGAIDVT